MALKKLDKKTIDKLIGLISKGIYLCTACKIIGVDRTTVWDWRQISKAAEAKHEAGEKLTEAEELLLGFDVALDAAASNAEDGVISSILVAGAEDWRASAWIAERRWRKRWGKPEPQGNQTNINQTNIGQQTNIVDQRQQIAELIHSDPEYLEYLREKSYRKIGYVNGSNGNGNGHHSNGNGKHHENGEGE